MNCTCMLVKYGFEEACQPDPLCPIHRHESTINKLKAENTLLQKQLAEAHQDYRIQNDEIVRLQDKLAEERRISNSEAEENRARQKCIDDLKAKNFRLREGLADALTYFPDTVGRYQYVWEECLSDEQEMVQEARQRLTKLRKEPE